ncbi:hypothetical protein [Streptomyces sp. MK7]|uniref:hypothetical protein n=1 Tax=Streptomyces sp. MK7 TaxID=3067635 RepID=UPI00292CA73A|nr:hypothetical protein [Streptomyces sp. MK7]
MKQKRRVAASLAAAVAMTFVGVGTAQAAKQPGAADGMTARAGIASAGGCDYDHDHNCPKPPPVPKGCFDIDSVIHGVTKYVSVVCNGRVFVLAVAEEPDGPHAIAPGWVATGGPSNVIDATVAEHGDNVYVTVLTAQGQVQEGTCDVGPGEPGPGNPITMCDFAPPFTRPPGT